MLPAQPPHSRRISPIWKETDSTCVCSGRMWRAKRSGNTMMVSNASEPQINVRMEPPEATGNAESTATARAVAATENDECRASGRQAACPFIASRPMSRTTNCWRRDTGSGFDDAVQQHFPVRVAVVVDAPLEAADVVARDEAIAVDADEARTELVLEPRQRFLEQVLALRGADRDVLELGLQIDDVLDRHQHDARALGHRQEAARRRGQLQELARRSRASSEAPFAARTAVAARAPA